MCYVEIGRNRKQYHQILRFWWNCFLFLPPIHVGFIILDFSPFGPGLILDSLGVTPTTIFYTKFRVETLAGSWQNMNTTQGFNVPPHHLKKNEDTYFNLRN